MRFFYPPSWRCDHSVTAEQIFAAAHEFMPACGYFQRAHMLRKEGTPKSSLQNSSLPGGHKIAADFPFPTHSVSGHSFGDNTLLPLKDTVLSSPGTTSPLDQFSAVVSGQEVNLD